VALKLARERGLWRGDVEAVIPATFDPEYVPKKQSPTREEVLTLLPHLSPDAAAAVCFVLATSAESAALYAARRSDIPEELDRADLRVRVRGTKNKFRDAHVVIVSDEQRLPLEYAARHAPTVRIVVARTDEERAGARQRSEREKKPLLRSLYRTIST
jgi:hypothetical protein